MTPVYTYRLKRPCGNMRPFCRPCVNSFAIDAGFENECETQPPAVICLESRLTDDSSLTECAVCKDDVAPTIYMAIATLPDTSTLGPYYLIGSDCTYASELFDLPDSPSQRLVLTITVPTRLDWYCEPSGLHTYWADEDVTTGAGCLQVLTFRNVGGSGFPTGIVVTLYPVTE